jgi:hypothetical protein
MAHDPPNTDELNIILLLDLARENPFPEALVRGQLPPGAPEPYVLRLSEHTFVTTGTGTPLRWCSATTAIERMLRAARDLAPSRERRRYWVAGRAGLPAFFYLGHRLSRWAAVTLVNQRPDGELDVLQLDQAGESGSAPFFTCSPFPERETLDEASVALVVASGDIPVVPADVEQTMSAHGTPAHLVEAQTSTWLGRSSLSTAIRELRERVSGMQRYYPRSHKLSVFIAGPVTLAFLVGRELNGNIFTNIEVFGHREKRYYPALTTEPPLEQPILFLAPNPTDREPLQLTKEAHDVQRALHDSLHSRRFVLVAKHEPRVMELRKLLKEIEPTIVHFSGHGNADRLLFIKDDGGPAPASSADIDHLFELGDAPIKLIVLNACTSEAIAERLLAHAECVIGMRWTIGDDAAIRFATELYGVLGDGESVQTAFDAGKRAVIAGNGRGASNDNELEIPQLKVRPGVDASTLVLIPPHA